MLYDREEIAVCRGYNRELGNENYFKMIEYKKKKRKTEAGGRFTAHKRKKERKENTAPYCSCSSLDRQMLARIRFHVQVYVMLQQPCRAYNEDSTTTVVESLQGTPVPL